MSESTRDAIARVLRAASDRFTGTDPQTGESDYWGRGGLAGVLGMPAWYEQSPQDIAMGFAGSATPKVGGPIRAFHGSPHDFDKFDLSKIGTGEGAQSYGRGLYFAESEPTARFYRDQLTAVDWPKLAVSRGDNGKWQLLQWHDNSPGSPTTLGEFDTKKSAMGRVNELLSAAEAAKPKGSMYEVGIHADPAQLLNWDTHISGQPDVAQKLQAAGINTMQEPRWYGPSRPAGVQGQFWNNGAASVRQSPAGTFEYGTGGPWNFKSLGGAESLGAAQKSAEPHIDPQSLTGQMLMHRLKMETTGFGPDYGAAVSDTLRDAGIPGIRYLDQGSRGTAGGQLIDVSNGPQGWQAKIKAGNRGGVGFADPTDIFTTSAPFSTEDAARQWADSKINGGTSNYVMFNPDLIEILRKYGLAGATVGGGAALGASDASAGGAP